MLEACLGFGYLLIHEHTFLVFFLFLFLVVCFFTALLMAARLHEFNRTAGDIVKIVKVHESTLRKRYLKIPCRCTLRSKHYLFIVITPFIVLRAEAIATSSPLSHLDRLYNVVALLIRQVYLPIKYLLK